MLSGVQDYPDDRATLQSYRVGEKLPDGWVFLGLSAVTGRAFSLAPQEMILERNMLCTEAEDLAAAFLSAGYKGARLPIEADYKKSELLQIFSIAALSPRHCYWMKALRPGDDFVFQQRNPDRFHASPGWSARVLIVRDEP